LGPDGKTLGRKALQEWASIVTPDTIMRWYRKLVTCEHDGSERRGPGRPPVINLLRELVVRMALENRLINPSPSDSAGADGRVCCQQRLGGMLNFYHRRAA